jgi:hypothetical protein
MITPKYTLHTTPRLTPHTTHNSIINFITKTTQTKAKPARMPCKVRHVTPSMAMESHEQEQPQHANHQNQNQPAFHVFSLPKDFNTKANYSNNVNSNNNTNNNISNHANTKNPPAPKAFFLSNQPQQRQASGAPVHHHRRVQPVGSGAITNNSTNDATHQHPQHVFPQNPQNANPHQHILPEGAYRRPSDGSSSLSDGYDPYQSLGNFYSEQGTSMVQSSLSYDPEQFPHPVVGFTCDERESNYQDKSDEKLVKEDERGQSYNNNKNYGEGDGDGDGDGDEPISTPPFSIVQMFGKGEHKRQNSTKQAGEQHNDVEYSNINNNTKLAGVTPNKPRKPSDSSSNRSSIRSSISSVSSNGHSGQQVKQNKGQKNGQKNGLRSTIEAKAIAESRAKATA